MNLNTVHRAMMRKVADGGVTNDAMSAALWNNVPYVGGLSALLGGVHGLVSGAPSKEGMKKIDDSAGLSWLPGVGASRFLRRQAEAVDNGSPRATVAADLIGSNLTAPLLLGAAGGLVGGPGGGLVGVGVGSAASILGTLIGLARKRRTPSEQTAADKDHSKLMSYLVPGVGSYNMARRMGAITQHEDARNMEKEQEKEHSKG